MEQTQQSPRWPAPVLDRLFLRVMERAIADAAINARRGRVDSCAHVWLWEHGRELAEKFGGKPYKVTIANICEELEIMALAAKNGERYRPQHPLLNKRSRKNQGDICHLKSVS